MPLTPVEIDAPDVRLPQAVADYLRAADERIDDFRTRRPDVPGFVPSDYARTYALLHAVLEGRHATGELFLEWGSGFGVAAGLASMLGYDAHGIEVDGDLVTGAVQLADDFNLQTPFVRGSLVPDGGHAAFLHTSGTVDWLVQGVPDGYDELGLDVDDFDVIYAYPWPGEESAIDTVFDAYAARGALLLTYHGINDVRVQRKR